MSAQPFSLESTPAGGVVQVLGFGLEVLHEARQLLQKQAREYGCASPRLSYFVLDARPYVAWSQGSPRDGAVEFV